MEAPERPPILLTILRQGETNIVDFASVGALVPRGESLVDSSFLQQIAAEAMELTPPGAGRLAPGASALPPSEDILQGFKRIGGLIFSQLLTEPARQHLRNAEPCNLYLRLDEQLIHVPWELCYDGTDFLTTKFRIGRQVITDYAIPGTGTERQLAQPIKMLLIVDPTESLPQAVTEADQLCALLAGVPGISITRIGGKAVRKMSLLAELENHDVIHFAGHSAYDRDNPTKSGWQLHDDVLTAGEISKLGTPPLLVFSNSCQAGTTAEWDGAPRYEGHAFGIGSAFLLAGVKNYIGTFWAVHDQESANFAAVYYRSIAAGQSLGTALQHAREAAIETHGWQGFTWASYTRVLPVQAASLSCKSLI